MKNADYKHRPLVALSTTGKLSPIPPRPPPELQDDPNGKTARVPQPRISPNQPAEDAVPAPETKANLLTSFLRGLVGKKKE